ncbi:HlyD family secretion protein [Siccirubricoccus sp. KC 17139]|uniref:HlyD family secretion protein n=1 Tax=Siccirubricoccus soli TaxID=2899147 RepID=A0ABT1D937_9PROT|nr:HlyD family secretion protein [Siccirubricoccus soli]MCO6417495.1 HlyD family secretion protein [Siccirubricoccus soli]MCP2683630.1 HlyD family secretion protein [Siccirubricoccus soli]
MPDATPSAPPPTLAAPPSGAGWRGLLIPLVLLLLAAGLVALFVTRWDLWVGDARLQRTDDAYLASDLTPIAARVAGYVRAVPVQDFQRVEAGQTLVELVDDDYRAQLAQAEAGVASAAAALEVLRAQRALQESTVHAADAAVEGQVAQVHRYRLEADRQRALLSTGIAGTRQLVEVADATAVQGSAQLAALTAQAEAARRQLGVLDAQLRQQEATLEGQRAALNLARINLGYTRIAAPEAGRLGQRQVRPGQYVGVGTSVNTLVPLPRLWVVANYRETQMTNVREGQPARVTVDAFPGLVLHGRVQAWSPASGAQFSLLPPDNATGNFTKVVQRIPVRIGLDLGEEPRAALLRPGMSVVATVDTAERQ